MLAAAETAVRGSANPPPQQPGKGNDCANGGTENNQRHAGGPKPMAAREPGELSDEEGSATAKGDQHASHEADAAGGGQAGAQPGCR